MTISSRESKIAAVQICKELDQSRPKTPAIVKNIAVATNSKEDTLQMIYQVSVLSAEVFKKRMSDLRARRKVEQRVRSATHTLMAIVSSYLICNSFSLVIKILERVPR